VYKLQDVCKSFDTIDVIDRFSSEFYRGDKIAVIGNNGQGKTTLLKLLAEILEPDAGTVTVGHGVQLGYFPQNHGEILDKSRDVSSFEWLKEHQKGLYDQEIRTILGRLLFSGEDAFKKILSLSGGETARLLLGRLMLEKPNVLILDEPNNHLDLEAVSALAWGLEKYQGTAIVASHDRELINSFAKKLIVFDNHTIHFFDGPLEEYLTKK
jgi:ATPase subunit of ABC transporter with duplicated ATPase domains